jgi:hypothetical protein
MGEADYVAREVLGGAVHGIFRIVWWDSTKARRLTSLRPTRIVLPFEKVGAV